MKLTALAVFATALLPAMPVCAQPANPGLASAAPGNTCAPDGTTRFVCGMHRPEDVSVLPGTKWVVASSIDGGLFVINSNTLESSRLYPSPTARERFDRATYAQCPGAPSAKEQAQFRTVGIATKPVRRGLAMLYVTHTGWDRSVDVFEVDTSSGTPVSTWVGCAVSPAGLGVDAIAPVENNGFVVTNWLNMGPGTKDELEHMKAGAVNGQLWSWYPGEGWNKLPGSESSGPNGIVVSPDHKTIFFNIWGGKAFARMSRGTGKPEIKTIPLDFRPDNVHWATDGSLLVGGATLTEDGIKVVRIDPKTMKVTPVFTRHDTEEFSLGTGATQVGNTLWLGTAKSDRIAVVPLP